MIRVENYTVGENGNLFDFEENSAYFSHILINAILLAVLFFAGNGWGALPR